MHYTKSFKETVDIKKCFRRTELNEILTQIENNGFGVVFPYIRTLCPSSFPLKQKTCLKR